MSKHMDWAMDQVGTMENRENEIKYNDQYYHAHLWGSNYPWCVVFVQRAFEAAGNPLPVRTASTAALLDWFRANRPDCVHSDPRQGDIAIYAGHTGLVYEVAGDGSGRYVGIEGNYSNRVAYTNRRKSEAQAFITWPENDGRMHKVEDVPSWGKPIIQRLIDRDILRGSDGDYDLSQDMLRVIVMLDRAGAFGK